MMTFEYTLLVIVGSSIAISGGILYAISGSKIPRWLDVLAAILLLLLSAVFLGITQSLLNELSVSASANKELQAQYQVALYLIPFFGAAIASNILSHVLLSQRKYDNTMRLAEAAKIMLISIAVALLWATVIGLVFHGAYLFLIKKKPV
jgi:uncharacterized membrane protein